MSCDPELLWTLVEQDREPGDEANSIAQHVESCVRCQQTLERLGGDGPWWQETRKWLSTTELLRPFHHDDDEKVESDESPLHPPIDLSFLDPPAHPEMLGRIGRYDVEGLLGRGGMGVVLRAHDQDLRRSVAVKVLAPEWAASPQARQRFAREAQAAASITHENVIPIYNVEPNAPLPFFVMRYIPGMTLEHWVRTEGPPDVATLLRVASQMAEGLAAAHRRGLIHRDIKPGNILIGHGIERVWITDFGLARAADSVTLTRTGVIAGTPHYMSPEQARGEAVEQASDYFSLGCVLYFLATGHPPFEAENTLAVLHQLVSKDAPQLQPQRTDLPPTLVSLVTQLLSRSPHLRPSSADEIIQQLSIAQTEHLAGKRAKRRWMSPSSLRVVAVSAICTLLLSIGLYLYGPSIGQRPPQTVATGDERSGIVANPFESTVPAFEASGYEINASDQIASISQNDADAFDRNVDAVSDELRRLQNSTHAESISMFALNDESWNQAVQSVRDSLKQLGSESVPSVPASIHWSADLREAHQQAQENGKLLLVHFYTDDCPYCERIEQGAFQDPVVQESIRRDFLPVKVHAPSNSNLTQMFKVDRFPTDVIVTVTGSILSHAVSPQDPVRYDAMLGTAKSNR